jgi:hypothetical protein
MPGSSSSARLRSVVVPGNAGICVCICICHLRRKPTRCRLCWVWDSWRYTKPSYFGWHAAFVPLAVRVRVRVRGLQLVLVLVLWCCCWLRAAVSVPG